MTALPERFMLNDTRCRTDNPLGADLFIAPEQPMVRGLDGRLGHDFAVGQLDAVPPGNYTLDAKVSRVDWLPNLPFKAWRSQPIVVTEHGEGVVLDERSLGERFERVERSADELRSVAPLLGRLGFKLDEETSAVIGIPTPNTFVSAAAKQDVRARLVNEAQLSDKLYLEIFADEHYPVGTGNILYYTHDTRDDHATAEVLGGRRLHAALGTGSRLLLQNAGNDPKLLQDGATAVDRYTSTLRTTVVDDGISTARLTALYGHDTLAGALRDEGLRAGITTQTTDMIISDAANRAQAMGVPVRAALLG